MPSDATGKPRQLNALWPFLGPHESAEAWPEEIRRRMLDHVETERSTMQAYERLASETEAEDLRYLMRIVLDDERRHHGWFRELANTLEKAVELRTTGPTVPARGHEPVSKELVEATERLLEIEREDARELEALRKKLKPVEHSTLWSVLIEIMQQDTEKHVRILEHIRDRARERVQRR